MLVDLDEYRKRRLPEIGFVIKECDNQCPCGNRDFKVTADLKLECTTCKRPIGLAAWNPVIRGTGR